MVIMVNYYFFDSSVSFPAIVLQVRFIGTFFVVNEITLMRKIAFIFYKKLFLITLYFNTSLLFSYLMVKFP